MTKITEPTDSNMDSLREKCPHLASYDPFDSRHLADPYPLWRESQSQAPVFYVEKAGYWAVTAYKQIEEVIRDTKTFTSRYSLNFPAVPDDIKTRLPWGYPQNYPSLINLDPPAHTRVRRLAGKTLTAPLVNAMEPKIKAITNDLIDRFIEQRSCDLVKAFTMALPVRVIAWILGVPEKDLDDFKRWSDYAFLLSNPTLDEAQLREISLGHAQLKDYLFDMVEQRRKTPEDDLISKLVLAREEGIPSLDTRQIISVVAQLLIGGNGTTTDLIANMMNIVLQDRELWTSICANPALCPEVVEETLRLKSSIRGLFRTTTREVTIGDVTLPEGAVVWVVFGASGHDECIFEEPEKFDIKRANKRQHMSFGKGNHMCIGAALARVEARVALELLSQRIPEMQVLANQVLEYPATPVSQGPLQLQVKW